MEKDDEVKGEGNSLDFGARIHDPRLGRFLSIDPLHSKFPGHSPYLFAGNNPIYYIDMEGKTKVTYLTIIKDGQTQIFKIVDHNYIERVADDYVVGLIYNKIQPSYHNHDILVTVVINYDNPSESSYKETDLGRADNFIESIGRELLDARDGNGIAFYSISGQGQETRMAKGKVRSENIDALLSTINAAKSTAKFKGALFNLPKLVGDWKNKTNQIANKVGDYYGAAEMLGSITLNSKIDTFRCDIEGGCGLLHDTKGKIGINPPTGKAISDYKKKE